MVKRTGIWLDHERAFLISLEGESVLLETVHSNIETRLKTKGEDRDYSRAGGKMTDPPKKITERRKHLLKEYFTKIRSKLSDSETVYIFGPAEAGRKLADILRRDKSFHAFLLDVEKADNMTENQMVAKVRNVFSLY